MTICTPYLAAAVILALSAPIAQADIFQWEYVDPANPSQGRQQSATLAPNGLSAIAAPGTNLAGLDLTMAYLVGADLSPFLDCVEEACYINYADLSATTLAQADLTNASLYGAILTGADLTGAEVRGVNFTRYYTGDPGGITATQLYSTASYQAHDLRGIKLSGYDLAGINLVGQNLAGAELINANLTSAALTYADFSTRSIYFFNNNQGLVTDLRGANLSQANLTNADFSGFDQYGPEGEYYPYLGASLEGANLSGADTRGANFYLVSWNGANTTNLIQSHGHIQGLDLTAGKSLIVRDYDDNAFFAPIVVDHHLTMDATGTLRLDFEADPWGSTISFATGIPVTLGGTLELTFAPDVNVATQSGRTIDLFDWSGVTPVGTFTISSPYNWNLSNLYTTGEVTLFALPSLQGDFNDDGTVDAADYTVWRDNLGAADESAINYAGDGLGGIDAADYAVWRSHFGASLSAAAAAQQSPVPEPSSWPMVVALMTWTLHIRSQSRQSLTGSLRFDAAYRRKVLRAKHTFA